MIRGEHLHTLANYSNFPFLSALFFRWANFSHLADADTLQARTLKTEGELVEMGAALRAMREGELGALVAQLHRAQLELATRDGQLDQPHSDTIRTRIACSFSPSLLASFYSASLRFSSSKHLHLWPVYRSCFARISAAEPRFIWL